MKVGSLILSLAMLTACAGKAPPGTSFESTVAIFGRQLTDSLRAAQQRVGTEGDNFKELRQQLVPAIMVFESVFKQAETLGMTLNAMDTTKDAKAKEQLATKALALVEAIDVSLNGVLKDVDNQKARDIVASALQQANVSRPITNLYRSLAPYLPKLREHERDAA